MTLRGRRGKDESSSSMDNNNNREAAEFIISFALDYSAQIQILIPLLKRRNHGPSQSKHQLEEMTSVLSGDDK